eukprot:1375240-Pyramimonas_sp.AAC.1
MEEGQKQVIQNKAGGERKTDRVSHDWCARTKRRAQHQCSGDPNEFEGWSDVDPETKARFYESSADLFGDALCKAMKETINVTKKRKALTRFRECGKYHPLEDVSEMPKFKNNPEALQQLLGTAPRHTCKYSGLIEIYVPEYEFVKDDEEEEEECKDRGVHGEKKLKRKAAPKEPKQPGAPRPKKLLTAVMRKKMEGLRDDIHGSVLALGGSIAVATAPAVAGAYVPPSIARKAQELYDELQARATEVAALCDSDETTKDMVTAAIDKNTTIMNQQEALSDKINGSAPPFSSTIAYTSMACPSYSASSCPSPS